MISPPSGDGRVGAVGRWKAAEYTLYLAPMAENERIPADFHQAMFRIAAIAFVTSATVNVGSSFIGGHFDFAGIFIIGILSYLGAVVSCLFPWHRLPVERFLLLIVMPGRVLLVVMLM